MSAGIIYLLTGPAHGVRLVTSIRSLRNHYHGPVTVFTTQPESHEIGRRCAADARLAVEHRTFEEFKSRKNSSFLTKLALLPESPYDLTLHLDADTMIAGDISPLFDLSFEDEFCATRFSNWHSGGRIVSSRIRKWRAIKQDVYDGQWYQQLINDALISQPAVNGGVFSYYRHAGILRPWLELAYVGRKTFICDEIALQMLLSRYPHQLLDCRFNCSPTYGILKEDARIWHFHGERHVRHPECRRLWLPLFETCLVENIAQLADWSPGADGRLQGYLAKASAYEA